MGKATAEINNFTGGLITEASPLTFPENTAADISNFVLKRDGSLERRLGLVRSWATSWFNETNDILDAAYIQTRATFNSLDDYGIIGYSVDSTDVDQAMNLLLFKHSEDPNITHLPEHYTFPSMYGGTSLWDFAQIGEHVVFVGRTGATLGDFPAVYILDDAATGAFSAVTIKVRDFWGIDDGLELTERPTTLTAQHRYNLQNQGWPEIALGQDLEHTSYGKIFSEFGSTGAGLRFPSNADMYGVSVDDVGLYSVGQAQKNNIYSRPAPQGKYLISPWRRTSWRRTEIATATYSSGTAYAADEERGHFACIASYAGRAWYSGIVTDLDGGDARSPDYTGSVFFTQIVSNKEDLAKCYQANDPTNVEQPDLLPNDGGILEIGEAGQIHKLVEVEAGLLVFADNGVWLISGPDGVFAADDFSVKKITSVGSESKYRRAVVVVESSVFYWNRAGIYVLANDPQSGKLVSKNITKATINSLYTTLAREPFVQGHYDWNNNTVRWWCNQAQKEIIFDLQLGAWYKHDFDLTDRSFLSYVPKFTATPDDYTSEYIFHANAGGAVAVYQYSSYVVTAFADFGDTTGAGGLYYDSYMTTGYMLFGDTQRDKWVPYITTHFTRTEDGFDAQLQPTTPSGCTMQARWNFADSGASGKWGSPITAYRYNRAYVPVDQNDPFDYGEEVLSTKHKLRGTGKALQLHFSSEDGKDCKLLGWGLSVGANTNV